MTRFKKIKQIFYEKNRLRANETVKQMRTLSGAYKSDMRGGAKFIKSIYRFYIARTSIEKSQPFDERFEKC